MKKMNIVEKNREMVIQWFENWVGWWKNISEIQRDAEIVAGIDFEELYQLEPDWEIESVVTSDYYSVTVVFKDREGNTFERELEVDEDKIDEKVYAEVFSRLKLKLLMEKVNKLEEDVKNLRKIVETSILSNSSKTGEVIM
jgi:hypothetical protein